MQRPRATSLLSVSAGIVFITGALLPWAQVPGSGVSYTAFRLGMYGPALAVIASGAALVIAGLSGTRWVSLVAMGTVFVAIASQLAAHTDFYQALTNVGQSVGGEAGFGAGFGTIVVFSAAGTAIVAAIAGAQSAEPVAGTTRTRDPGPIGPGRRVPPPGGDE